MFANAVNLGAGGCGFLGHTLADSRKSPGTYRSICPMDRAGDCADHRALRADSVCARRAGEYLLMVHQPNRGRMGVEMKGWIHGN